MTGKAVSQQHAAYIGVLQFVQALGWVVYAIFLPQLAARMGLGPTAVLLILLLDQATFAVCDYLVGIAADRTARIVGRLGTIVAGVTVVSGLAFVALPFIADGGDGALPLFIAVTVIWTVTSAALRAPPLMLLGKYAARPQLPWLAALVMLGLGLSGAAAPYLAILLRETDPHLPFAVASLAVVLPALALARVERAMAAQATSTDGGSVETPAVPASQETAAAPSRAALPFAVAVVVLALGFQVHFLFNTPPLFRRFVSAEEIGYVLPIFFAGFNIAMFPAGLIARRHGGLAVMGGAGLLGAGALLAASLAQDFGMLAAAQFFAGAAWGAILMSAFTAAVTIGANGAEGRTVGLLFSGLAVAAFARIAAMAAGLPADPALAATLDWLPTVCWIAGGGAALWLATHMPQRQVPA